MWCCTHDHTATSQAQKELRCELGVCYDQESGQVLDIYYPSNNIRNGGVEGVNGGPPQHPQAVLIYIHGGYWSSFG